MKIGTKIALVGLAFTSVLSATTTPIAHAKAHDVDGMPKVLRHVWHQGKYKTKITKYHIYWAPKGGKYTTHISFKSVWKQGNQYTVNSGKVYQQTAYWVKGHTMYHIIAGDPMNKTTKSVR